jgi:hypothetical protein
MKNCPKCETEKPFTEFYKNKNRKYGLATYCKICSATMQSQHFKVAGTQRMIMTHLECSCCKRIKEANRENFTINKTYVSGFNTRCKVCIKIKHTKYQKHARSYLTDQYVIQCIKSELKNKCGLKFKTSEIDKETIKLKRKELRMKRKFRKDPEYKNAKPLRLKL